MSQVNADPRLCSADRTLEAEESVVRLCSGMANGEAVDFEKMKTFSKDCFLHSISSAPCL